MSTTLQKIEALLFYLNEEVRKKRVAELVGISLEELEEAVGELGRMRRESGIVLVETPTTISLGTHPDTSKLIDSVRKVEKEAPLSKTALETLAVIAYRAPITRAEIDTIRGVNSMYSIRNLLVRGLVARRNLENQVIYEPTADTLKLLGISTQLELPDYDSVSTQVAQIMGEHMEDVSEGNE
ncbi:MAG: SMC-Scp complex subunit ScpB [Patescibacteria group bacterium]